MDKRYFGYLAAVNKMKNGFFWLSTSQMKTVAEFYASYDSQDSFLKINVLLYIRVK